MDTKIKQLAKVEKLEEVDDNDICPICFNDIVCDNIKCKECHKTCCIDCINNFKGRSFSVHLEHYDENYFKYEESSIFIKYPCSFCRFNNVIALDIFNKKELLKLVLFDYQRVIKNNEYNKSNIKYRLEYLEKEINFKTSLLHKVSNNYDEVYTDLLNHIEHMKNINDFTAGKYKAFHLETQEKEKYARLYKEAKKELLELKREHKDINQRILKSNKDVFEAYLKLEANKKNNNELFKICNDTFNSYVRPTKRENIFFNKINKFKNKKLQIPTITARISKDNDHQDFELNYDKLVDIEL